MLRIQAALAGQASVRKGGGSARFRICLFSRLPPVSIVKKRIEEKQQEQDDKEQDGAIIAEKPALSVCHAGCLLSYEGRHKFNR